MNFSFFLALKYLKPKRSVASVITLVSVLGVMLGVSVVIIVRSVMTGFGDIWEEKILDFKPHITVVPTTGHIIYDEYEKSAVLREIPGITSVTPQIDTQVLLSKNSRVLAPILIGVEGDEFVKAYKLGYPRSGSFDLDGDTIILGVHAARQLGVRVGDEVVVYSPKTLVSNDEVFLPIKWRVGGIFSTGQYEYESKFAVASLANVRDLMGMDNGVLAIHIKVANPVANDFALIESNVIRAVGSGHRSISWREADSEIFNALAVEKNMTALLLSLISLVAVFCVMNTLLVLTVQKTSAIGLLKALGFSKFKIMSVFVVHGMIQCVSGIVLGLLASWAILSNLQNIVDALARFGMEVFPPSIYGLAEIPHRVIVSDIVWVVALVFVFGLIASLVPALAAASKDPVKALNS